MFHSLFNQNYKILQKVCNYQIFDFFITLEVYIGLILTLGSAKDVEFNSVTQIGLPIPKFHKLISSYYKVHLVALIV